MANKTQQQHMMSIFAAEYLGKIYYYCMKRTSSVSEAEDLSHEIALDVVAAIKKGTIPQRFSAWVWQIARNKYATWADRKSKNRRRFTTEDIETADIMNDPVLSELARSEELKLLRRELSLIAKDYRDIVVAYYVDDMKIRTIASALNLPIGTVMSKLYRARKILKEGMNMAREFGTRSYKPENVHFAASGSQHIDRPWKAVGRRLPKNILLEAHNNPSTMEELAVEIGTAMPYMEEEVQLLVDAELLIKTGDKYVTSFFIACKECQLEVYNASRKGSKERSTLLNEIANDTLPTIRQLCSAGEHISDNDLKWLTLALMADLLPRVTRGEIPMFKRKDGGDWGFMGYEAHNLIAEDTGMGHNGMGYGLGSDNVMLSRFNYHAYNIGIPQPSLPDYSLMPLISDIAKNNRSINSFSAVEKDMWKKIDGCFAHADSGGNVVFDIAVFKGNAWRVIEDIIKPHTHYPALLDAYRNLTGEVKAILTKYANPVMRKHLDYYVDSFMCDTRMMVITDVVEAKGLVVPENPETCCVGMYLEVG